jgi:hypothetical protein
VSDVEIGRTEATAATDASARLSLEAVPRRSRTAVAHFYQSYD